MIREIVHYDNPVLRAKGKPVPPGPASPEIRKLVDDLFDTMRAARGVGLAAQQIIQDKVYFSNNKVYYRGDTVGTYGSAYVPHIFATAGYRFLLDEDFNLVPSVMMKYVAPLPLQFDFNLKLQYRDLAWIG